ncbi:phosphoglycerate kinase [Lampropedia aestuarii]|uniref:Phosphoglycerate kinase n=1 Tax=Lampropedia aestuarii TaxID=2562762 RepID=A0A4S5BNF0_9BURK|nr:histidine phosphatase family protein [Lampropedia aestuarii]THJ32613.1 phosphoglycerate kinase [Lampropedia aestuarii]
MNVWWMRHPRVVLPAPLCYGASDVPVDEEHAQQCALLLAQQLPANCQVITSERQRTQTVARQLQALRPDLPEWHVDARLNEMDFGCWEMVPWQQIPRTQLDAWNAEFSNYLFGGQESVAHLAARAQAACQAFEQQAQQSGQSILCITHAGIINAVQYVLQNPAAPIPRASTQWPAAPVPYGQARQWQSGNWTSPDWQQS